MTTLYFADSFPPTNWDQIVGNQPTWTTVLTDLHVSAPSDLIRYSLYEDNDTFADWITWSYDNRLTTNLNFEDYDGNYVLAIEGIWPQLTDESTPTDDMMCIADAAVSDNMGTICIMTDKTNSDTKTYNFTNGQWTAFLAAYTSGADAGDGAIYDYSTDLTNSGAVE